MTATTLRLATPDDARMNLRDPQRLLRIFLRDHLAALTAGIALIRRSLKENRDEPLGRVLAPVHVALQEDRVHLRRLAEELGVRPGRVKSATATVAERLGRLKLNGRLFRYSPLSRVTELEGLVVLCAQRVAMWKVLERHARTDRRFDVVDHASRAHLAERQRQSLERELVAASLGAF